MLTRTVVAFNTATQSENKIHDDETASRFGFTGGLVPGVDVFAYMAHAPLKIWGERWLGGGSMRARFLRPVYDGEEAVLEARSTQDGLELALKSRDALCATGEARCDNASDLADIPECGAQPDELDRPPASASSLPVGKVLGYPVETYTREAGLEHLEAVREDVGLYDGGLICNPAYMLRRINYILATNVKLGPWIHSESEIFLHRVVRDGESLDVRARVIENFERKGHLIVALRFAVLADGEPAMTGRHWAIYEPRQVRG